MGTLTPRKTSEGLVPLPHRQVWRTKPQKARFRYPSFPHIMLVYRHMKATFEKHNSITKIDSAEVPKSDALCTITRCKLMTANSSSRYLYRVPTK